MYPDLRLFSQDRKNEAYLGAKDTTSMKQWIDKTIREFLVPITKPEIKKDAKKRGLKCFFALYGPQDNYNIYKKKYEEIDAFMYYVESDIEKLVAYR